jgi:hypothetical protein
MRKQSQPIFILFLLTTALLSCVGQRKNMSGFPPTLTKEQTEQENKNRECLRTKEFKADNRLAHSPFNSSPEILLVSFNTIGDTESLHTLPVEKNKIDFSKITEKKLLSTEEIDSLTDIFYNYGYRGEIYDLYGSACYNPRNAILFFDSNHELLEYIEICFECSGNKVSSDRIEWGDDCTGKYDLLKAFFLNQGIEIGTVRDR